MLREALLHYGLLPFTRLQREGFLSKEVGLHQSEQEGAGTGGGERGGHRPSWEPASHPGVETPSRGGASPRVTGDMDPEESEANC